MATPAYTLTDAVRMHMGKRPRADEVNGQWFNSILDGIAEHGASWGVPGFTYYAETAAFYDEHHDLIWEVLGDECDASGYESPLALIADFKGAWTAGRPWRRQLWGDGSFKNLLAWYALQYVARVSVEDREQGKVQ